MWRDSFDKAISFPSNTKVKSGKGSCSFSKSHRVHLLNQMVKREEPVTAFS